MVVRLSVAERNRKLRLMAPEGSCARCHKQLPPKRIIWCSDECNLMAKRVFCEYEDCQERGTRPYNGKIVCEGHAESKVIKSDDKVPGWIDDGLVYIDDAIKGLRVRIGEYHDKIATDEGRKLIYEKQRTLLLGMKEAYMESEPEEQTDRPDPEQTEISDLDQNSLDTIDYYRHLCGREKTAGAKNKVVDHALRERLQRDIHMTDNEVCDHIIRYVVNDPKSRSVNDTRAYVIALARTAIGDKPRSDWLSEDILQAAKDKSCSDDIAQWIEFRNSVRSECNLF